MLHRECVEELGHCPTYGCQGDPLSYLAGIENSDEAPGSGPRTQTLSPLIIGFAVLLAMSLSAIAALVLFS
jgi:hypothetical protein